MLAAAPPIHEDVRIKVRGTSRARLNGKVVLRSWLGIGFGASESDSGADGEREAYLFSLVCRYHTWLDGLRPHLAWKRIRVKVTTRNWARARHRVRDRDMDRVRAMAMAGGITMPHPRTISCEIKRVKTMKHGDRIM